MAYESINPFNGKTVKAFADINDDAVEQLVPTADRTFRGIVKQSGNPAKGRDPSTGSIHHARQA